MSLSTEPLSHRIFHPADLSSSSLAGSYEAAKYHAARRRPTDENGRIESGKDVEIESWLRQYLAAPDHVEVDPAWLELSPWSRSAVKRIFDCACVLLSLPVLIPLILAISAAVLLTSRGPVFFSQKRVGWRGRSFTILKFRTMAGVADAEQNPISSLDDQRFTRVGPFLRHWKLDELPQLANVLLGHMSLVGPRPKVREHEIADPPCRPGVTGLATVVFAREERILGSVGRDRLDDYFHSVVLPAKRQLDAVYMARATFLSDVRLLFDSVLRRWETKALDEFIVATTFGMKEETASSKTPDPARTVMRPPKTPAMDCQTEAEEASSG